MKKVILLFSSLLLLTVGARAQTPYEINPPQPGASFAVCSFPEAGFPCINRATIYSDSALTQPLSQPVSLGVSGSILFYVTNGAAYRLQIYGGANQRQYIIYGLGTGSSSGVISLNTLTGALTLANGANVSITPSGGNTLTIASTGGGGSVLDLTAGTGYFASAQFVSLICTSGSSSVTLSGSAADFVVGNTIALLGCGPTTSESAPTSLTVTPEGTTGSTSYNYCIEGIDSHGSTTPRSCATSSTGNASLGLLNYNQICWSFDTNLVAYIIYGRTGASGTLTRIGRTEDSCYADPGFEYHFSIDPIPTTNPSTSAQPGILETTISSISGSSWVLASPAGTVSGPVTATTYHDGSIPLRAALTGSCVTAGTCTIFLPPSSGAYVFVGDIGLTEDYVTLQTSGHTDVLTLGNIPLFNIQTGVFNFNAIGGVFAGKVISVGPGPNASPPGAGVANFFTFTGQYYFPPAGGPYYAAGNIFTPYVEDAVFTGEEFFIEDGINSLNEGMQLRNIWLQGGSCADFLHSGSSGGWLWDTLTLEGPGTQNCPLFGLVNFAFNPSGNFVDGFTMINGGTSDYNPATPAPVFQLAKGGMEQVAFYNVSLPNSNGDIFKISSAGYLTDTLFSKGSLSAPNGSLFNGPACGVLIEGAVMNDITFDPTAVSPSCPPAEVHNTFLLQTGASSGVYILDYSAIGKTDIKTAGADIPAGSPVKISSSSSNTILPTTTSDTGAGIPIGIAASSCTSTQQCVYTIAGQVTTPIMGTGTCTRGQFVIVDTTTNADVKCTSSYSAGAVIGVVTVPQSTVGNALSLEVGLR